MSPGTLEKSAAIRLALLAERAKTGERHKRLKRSFGVPVKNPLNQQERVLDIAAEDEDADELDVGGEHSDGMNTSSQYVAMVASLVNDLEAVETVAEDEDAPSERVHVYIPSGPAQLILTYSSSHPKGVDPHGHI